jgi:hypothetical protein
MEVFPQTSASTLTVRFTDEEAEAIIAGASFSHIDKTRVIEVHPLSDIDERSRPIEPRDKARVRNALGSLTARASVIRNQTIIYIPEPFAQHRSDILAEHISVTDISGNINLRPVNGIRVEFSE